MPDTRRHLKLLRAQSNYPTFRGLVAIAFWLGILFAVVQALIGLGLIGQSAGSRVSVSESFVANGSLLLLACAQIIGAKFFYECASMIADIADGIVSQSAKKRDD
jgi:hypothetical protein